MTENLSKSDYVKLRYLGSGNSIIHNTVKRRKKTKHSGADVSSTATRMKNGGIKIVDEDAWGSGDVEASTSGVTADSEGEDEKPVVAVFDNRTKKQRDLDEFKNSNRWKKVARDDESEAISRRGHEGSGGVAGVVEGDGSNSTRRRFDSDSDGDVGGLQHSFSRDSSRNNSDSDLEVDRRKEHLKVNERHDSRKNLNNPENKRCRRRSNDPDLNPRRNKPIDDDLSPVRLRRTSLEKDDSAPHSSTKQPGNCDAEDYDSDLSPPRATFSGSNSPAPSTVNRQSSSAKPTKTLSGAKAGLQTAQAMRLEAQHIRNREDSLFGRLTDDASGRNAKAVQRRGIRPKGKKPEPTAEEIAKRELLEKKYQAWGRGIKQAQSQETRRNEVLHEIDKPLARHKGDTDLENHLKQQTLAEDPMLEYVRKKQHAAMKGRIQFPKYQGPAPPINRYGIMPGYRWDGVDRSNGFEERLQQSQSSKKADAEEYYKWSYGTHE